MSSTHSTIHILGIPGSLREESFNKGLLYAAQEEAPENVKIEIFELDEIPFFNQDVEAQGDPEPVQELKAAIDQADAVLIATPEYQHGIPGVLKNALDWASRMPGESPLNRKIVGMMGATISPVGTARSQVHLHEILIYNQCHIVAAPEVLVANAPDKFENGRFSDDEGRKFIRQHLEALTDEVKKAER
ncbi:MAG TPA: NAD(P)H-dependent oxidoreductase [Fodinibius sp.]|nr:NAD(P)H-dependent oxidoreductase [Fodinibius sp.]